MRAQESLDNTSWMFDILAKKRSVVAGVAQPRPHGGVLHLGECVNRRLRRICHVAACVCAFRANVMPVRVRSETQQCTGVLASKSLSLPACE